MMHWLCSLLMLGCWVMKVLLISHVVITLLRLPDNAFTRLVNRVLNPMLNPIRSCLRERLPEKLQFLDWSPVVLYLLVVIAGDLIASLRGIF